MDHWVAPRPPWEQLGIVLGITGPVSALPVRRRQPLGARRLAAVGWRAAVISGVAASAALLLAAVASRHGALQFDFRGDLYNAGRDILHGRDPYRPSVLAQLAAIKRAGGSPNPTFAIPVYPAPALVAAAPLALLPFWLASVVFTGLALAAIVTALRLLGVRDWRCTVLAIISWPSLFGLYLGTLGPFLLLGIALAWRLRNSASAAASAIAGTVASKLFPWPLLLWALIGRRWRMFALSALFTVLALVASWALIGFHGLAAYPRILSDLSLVERGRGVSMTTTLLSVGFSPGLAQLVALATATALVAGAWRATRGGRSESAFGLIVIAALVASPLVWEHYLLLLFAPIALSAPRLSPVWFIPTLSGLIPTPNVHSPREMLFWLGLQLVVVGWIACPASLRQHRLTRPVPQARAAES